MTGRREASENIAGTGGHAIALCGKPTAGIACGAVHGFRRTRPRSNRAAGALAGRRAPHLADRFSSLAADSPIVNVLSLSARRGYTLPGRTGSGSLAMYRRALLLAATAVFVPTLAMADASIAGQWQANLPDNVILAMDILDDGYWTSQTVHNNKVVAQMAGTYEQTKTGHKSGTLVFTPVKSKVSAEHGAAKVETDKYRLEKGGTVLRLVAGTSEPMVFKRQPLAK